MKERCPSGSARHFCDGGGAGRIASLVPGGPGPSPESAESSMGSLTVRGPTVRFACRVLTFSPSPPPCSLPEPSLALSQALAPPEPDAALPQALLSPSSAHSPSPPCFGPSPPSERLLPEPALCAQSPPLSSPSSLSSALRACVLAGRKRAFACGVPGALRGTWVSPTRFDEMNDPCPRNVLI